jgi:hypothetical protein
MATTFLAYDLLSNDLIDEIPFTSFSYAQALNKAGGFEATIPLEHPKATPGNLDPWRTAIYVDRDGVLLFGGIVTDVSASLASGGSLKFGGIGFLGFYEGDRVVIDSSAGMEYEMGAAHPAIGFSGVDQFRIAKDFILHGNSKTGQDIGLTVAWDALSGVTRDRTYSATDRKSVGGALADLAKLDNGFDYAVRTYWDSGAPAKELKFYYSRKGRALDLVFEAGKNVQLLSYSKSGAKQSNYVHALGAGDGRNMNIETSENINDYYPTAAYPRLDAVTSHRDVSDNTTLAAHALADRLRNRHPLETLEIQIQDTAEAGPGSYEVGDDVLVQVQAGYLDLYDSYRIQELRVEYRPEGSEAVRLGLVSLNASLGNDD